jgi:hypothetical protein
MAMGGSPLRIGVAMRCLTCLTYADAAWAWGEDQTRRAGLKGAQSDDQNTMQGSLA